MSKDFPSKQGKSQGNTPLFGPEESGVPATGFTEAPLTPQDRGAAGPGLPGNTRKIH